MRTTYPASDNISSFVILSPDESYQDYAKTLGEARQLVDDLVLRDTAAEAVAAWKDPEFDNYAETAPSFPAHQRLLDAMSALMWWKRRVITATTGWTPTSWTNCWPTMTST